MDILCSHIIKTYLDLSQSIEIKKIAKQWWIINLEDYQISIHNSIQGNNIDSVLKNLKSLYENSTCYEQATIINSVAELANVQLANTLSNPVIKKTKGRPTGSL